MVPRRSVNRADVERRGVGAGDHGADVGDGQPGQCLAHGQPDRVGGLAGPVQLGEGAEQLRGRGGVGAGVVDGAGAVAVGPGPHVGHVAAEQRGGVHAGGERGGGLFHPPGHLPGVGDGADEVGGAADRLGGVLAADRHAPGEGGGDAGDVFGVEHLDGAEPGAVPGGGGVDVGAGFGDQHGAGMVDDPVPQHAALSRSGQGQDEGLVLGAGEDAAAVLGAAEPDGVFGGAGGDAVVQPHRRAGSAAVVDGGEPGPADGQLGEGGEPGSGPQPGHDPPPHPPHPLRGEQRAPGGCHQHEADREQDHGGPGGCRHCDGERGR